jgi:ferrochelatase
MSAAAVILMAYGSPDRLSDVPAYYADIRGGRPVRQELLDDLVDRYRGLGIDDSDAPSPLNAVTEATRASLEAELGLPVRTGMRHWEPRIATAVDEALADGGDLLVGLVLAPHFSTMSIAKYEALFDDSVAGRAETRFVRRWGAEPGFVDALARRVRAVAGDGEPHVVFTAHSLPARIVDAGDPYRDELLETAALVADAAAIGDWSFSFQSESQTGEPWLGPDILDHRCAGLPGRLRLRPPRDPLGPRRRGRGAVARARPRVRADRDAERRARPRRRARGHRAPRARRRRGMRRA